MPASPAGGREKVLAAARWLFNEHGVHAVSTRQIAERVGMSAGNLYYHFRTKEDLVLALCDGLESDVMRIVQLPDQAAVTIDHVVHHTARLFAHLWNFRFFYRDLVSHLPAMPRVEARYRELSESLVFCGRSLFMEMMRAGMLDARPAQIPLITTNAWILLSHWFSYKQSMGAARPLARADLLEGVAHFAALFQPYMEQGHRARLELLLTDAAFAPLFDNAIRAAAAPV